MRIEREHAAAIVIDYQEKLMPVMDRREALIENTKGLGGTVKELTQAAGTAEFVEKLRFSAWQAVASSHPWILGKKYIILCGIESHICVQQTMLELKGAGFVPVLVTDCISSRKRTDYEGALVRAQQEGAILTTYEALLFELLEEAGTDESKKIQRLVK